jgi:hypothetical protein
MNNYQHLMNRCCCCHHLVAHPPWFLPMPAVVSTWLTMVGCFRKRDETNCRRWPPLAEYNVGWITCDQPHFQLAAVPSLLALAFY